MDLDESFPITVYKNIRNCLNKHDYLYQPFCKICGLRGKEYYPLGKVEIIEAEHMKNCHAETGE